MSLEQLKDMIRALEERDLAAKTALNRLEQGRLGSRTARLGPFRASKASFRGL